MRQCPYFTLLIVLLIPLIASAQTLPAGAEDYRAVIDSQLGPDRAGLIIEKVNGDWRVISVGSAALAAHDVADVRATARAHQEAQLISSAEAKRGLGEFVSGVRVKAKTVTERDSHVSSDETAGRAFEQYITSHLEVAVDAFLRGTQEAARWDAADGKCVLTAVSLRASDVDRANRMAARIEGRPDEGKRVLVLKDERDQELGHPIAEVTRVRALGMAALAGTTPEKARRAALFDALQRSVEQVAGMKLTSATFVQNLDKVRANIHIATAGSVKSFTITEEGEKDGQWRVLVEAEIQPSFASAMELIKLFLNDPSLCVAGPAEPSLLKREVVPVAQDVRSCLQRAGIRVTDDHGPTNQLADGFTHANTDHATVLVWCDPSNRTVQAYRVATQQPIGKTLTQIWMRDSKFDRRCALADADAAGFVNSICLYWNDLIFNGTGLRVVIANISDLHRQTRAFRKAVQNTQGFRSIEQLSGDATKGEAIFTVRVAGANDAFLDALYDEIDSIGNEQLKSLKLQKQEGDCIYLAFD